MLVENAMIYTHHSMLTKTGCWRDSCKAATTLDEIEGAIGIVVDSDGHGCPVGGFWADPHSHLQKSRPAKMSVGFP